MNIIIEYTSPETGRVFVFRWRSPCGYLDTDQVMAQARSMFAEDKNICIKDWEEIEDD